MILEGKPLSSKPLDLEISRSQARSNTHKEWATEKLQDLNRGYPIKILRIFLIVGHPRDPKGEDHGYLKTCEVLTLLLSIIFLKNGRDLHSPCVPVISGASFSKEKNLRKVVGYPLSKSCNFSVAHSLCVFDRAWLLEISESSGLDERGAPSSIICPFLF